MEPLDNLAKKYFITGFYGAGVASWFSKLENSELYDRYGGVINSGNMRFRSTNNTFTQGVTACFPVSHFRFGIGIAFEEFYLDQITLQNSESTTITDKLIFDEKFRMDKLFFTVEYLLNPNHKYFNFSGAGHIGYFNLSGVDRLNFFGVTPVSKTYFLNLGLNCDIRIFKNTYLFLYPHTEFKLFINSQKELPSKINHRIISGAILGGIRIDLSKE